MGIGMLSMCSEEIALEGLLMLKKKKKKRLRDLSQKEGDCDRRQTRRQLAAGCLNLPCRQDPGVHNAQRQVACDLGRLASVTWCMNGTNRSVFLVVSSYAYWRNAQSHLFVRWMLAS